MSITIGAAHPGGTHGILYRLLAKEGFTAQRYNTRDDWVATVASDWL